MRLDSWVPAIIAEGALFALYAEGRHYHIAQLRHSGLERDIDNGTGVDGPSGPLIPNKAEGQRVCLLRQG